MRILRDHLNIRYAGLSCRSCSLALGNQGAELVKLMIRRSLYREKYQKNCSYSARAINTLPLLSVELSVEAYWRQWRCFRFAPQGSIRQTLYTRFHRTRALWKKRVLLTLPLLWINYSRFKTVRL